MADASPPFPPKEPLRLRFAETFLASGMQNLHVAAYREPGLQSHLAVKQDNEEAHQTGSRTSRSMRLWWRHD